MTDALLPANLNLPLHAGRPVTSETPFVRWLLIGIAVLFMIVFLLMPLITVFGEAFASGVGAYFDAISEHDAWAFLILLDRKSTRLNSSHAL